MWGRAREGELPARPQPSQHNSSDNRSPDPLVTPQYSTGCQFTLLLLQGHPLSLSGSDASPIHPSLLSELGCQSHPRSSQFSL